MADARGRVASVVRRARIARDYLSGRRKRRAWGASARSGEIPYEVDELPF